MRSSRISQETSRIMSALNSSTSTSVPQRTTRSLRRYMHENNTGDVNGAITDANQPSNNDLSDSQSHSTNTSSFSTRKRKRDATAQAVMQKKTVKVEKSTTVEPITTSSKRSKKGQSAKKAVNKSGNLTVKAPSDWEALYSRTKEM